MEGKGRAQGSAEASEGVSGKGGTDTGGARGKGQAGGAGGQQACAHGGRPPRRGAGPGAWLGEQEPGQGWGPTGALQRAGAQGGEGGGGRGGGRRGGQAGGPGAAAARPPLHHCSGVCAGASRPLSPLTRAFVTSGPGVPGRARAGCGEAGLGCWRGRVGVKLGAERPAGKDVEPEPTSDPPRPELDGPALLSVAL